MRTCRSTRRFGDKNLGEDSLPVLTQVSTIEQELELSFLTGSEESYAKAFQVEVKSVSSNWPSYCLIQRNWPAGATNPLRCYDSSSGKWCSFGDFGGETVSKDGLRLLSFAGALKIISGAYSKVLSGNRNELQPYLIAENVLTKTFKDLEVQNVFPEVEIRVKRGETFHLLRDGVRRGQAFHLLDDGFMVVSVEFENHSRECAIEIYDCNQGCWEIDQFKASRVSPWFDAHSLVIISSTLTQDKKLIVLFSKVLPSTIQFVIYHVVTKQCEMVPLRYSKGCAWSFNFIPLRILAHKARVIIVGVSSGDRPPNCQGVEGVDGRALIQVYEFLETSRMIVQLSAGYMVGRRCSYKKLSIFCDDENLYIRLGRPNDRESGIHCFQFSSGAWRFMENKTESRLLGKAEIWCRANREGLYYDGWFSPGMNPFLNPSTFHVRV